jgi:hypothetical protein
MIRGSLVNILKGKSVKHLEPLVVTQPLLNELSTLAAPSMLAAALRAAFTEVGTAYPETLNLCSYSAEFKEGAREGDTVQVALEETAGTLPGNREFDLYFSKGEKLGRVGKWHLAFANRTNARPLPYSISQADADGRTDSQLWRPQPAVATGNLLEDAQSLLWLAGQSARGYMKRLDTEFAAGVPEMQLQDDLNTRNYGGIVAVTHMVCWPAPGETLHCALEYQLPLAKQAPPDKKMIFHGVLTTERDQVTCLLGTFRFTIVRLNAQRLSIYPDGSTERR